MGCKYLTNSPSEGSGRIFTTQQGKFAQSTKNRGLYKTYYGFSLIDLRDSSNETLPAESDITHNDLFQLCLEHLKRNQKTTNQIEEISELTADQANDKSGEWI